MILAAKVAKHSEKIESISYVAFLRGINVGGHNVVKMEQLTKLFASLEFTDVRIYIQSGNVVFCSDENNEKTLTEKIESGLSKLLQKEVKIMLRSMAQLQGVVNKNPFDKVAAEGKVKFYVTFLCEEPETVPALPLISAKKDVEIFLVENWDVFSVSRSQNGHFGFPNEFVEKKFGVCATTRNWSTIKKIVSQ